MAVAIIISRLRRSIITMAAITSTGRTVIATRTMDTMAAADIADRAARVDQGTDRPMVEAAAIDSMMYLITSHTCIVLIH